MAGSPGVVIVGAGPVGLSAALFLVAEGIPVTVLEAEARLPDDMRASTFHPPTLDMLAPSGIADALIAQGHRAVKWQYVRADTRDAAVFDLSVLADQTDHPYRLQCEQFKLTKTIVAHLRGHPLCQIVFGATVIGLSEAPGGVRVDATIGDSLTSFRGAYAIATDGAKSTVRGLVGLDLRGETYPRTSITVTLDFPFERHMGEMLFVNYVWTVDDHYSLMRVGEGWRVGFSPAAGEPIEEAISDERIQERLGRLLPSTGPYPIRHKGAYTVHRRIVDTFRIGRVLLAGDAAHLNSPSGGMGMNSGIHDARALADELVPVLAGSDPARLDRYARRRRTVAVDDVHAQSDASYRRHRERDPAKREEIWRELKEITADPARMRAFLLTTSMIASVRRATQLA